MPLHTQECNQTLTPDCFADSNLPLAVVVARTGWNEVPRIRHHVTRQLARRFNVLFVQFFPTDIPEGCECVPQKISDKLMTVWSHLSVKVPKRLYANDPITHSVVNRRLAKQVVELVCAASAREPAPILFSFVYDFPEIMREDLFAFKAYVCYDEFPRMQRRAFKRNVLKAWYQATLFQHYENQVARRADRCFTPHYPLRDKLLEVNSHVTMLFHAHDFDHPPAVRVRQRSGPIRVGFAGFIDWRLLTPWLIEVLQQSDMELYLIGPVNPKYDLTALREYRSLHYVAPVPEDQLLKRLVEMDVLIMPYDPEVPEVSILTTNSKIFQYVASGRPIVISDLPHYIELPEGVIYKAADRADFVARIRQAHTKDNANYIQIRRQVALDNTWNSRGDQLFKAIASHGSIEWSDDQETETG